MKVTSWGTFVLCTIEVGHHESTCVAIRRHARDTPKLLAKLGEVEGYGDDSYCA